jgi:DNA-binding XRE family transcriptional regulator
MHTSLSEDTLPSNTSEQAFSPSTRLRPSAIGLVPDARNPRDRFRPSAHGRPPNHTAPHPPRDVSSRFGLRLRELRRERNLTQLRMATDFGIDRSFISDVERGRKSISLPMLEVIALGMKITLSELLRDI